MKHLKPLIDYHKTNPNRPSTRSTKPDSALLTNRASSRKTSRDKSRRLSKNKPPRPLTTRGCKSVNPLSQDKNSGLLSGKAVHRRGGVRFVLKKESDTDSLAMTMDKDQGTENHDIKEVEEDNIIHEDEAEIKIDT